VGGCTRLGVARPGYLPRIPIEEESVFETEETPGDPGTEEESGGGDFGGETGGGEPGEPGGGGGEGGDAPGGDES